GGATTGAYGNGRGGSATTSRLGGGLSSRGFGSSAAGGGAGGGLGGSAGGFDNRLGAGGADNRLGGSLVGGGAGGLVGRGGSGVGASFDNRIGGAGGDYKVTDLNDPSSVLSRRVIYFAYDQSTIEPEYFEILDAHSELLASNPNLTIRLEGHADERGSREYNVALSERRAQAVKQFMDLKGVGSEQSQTVAYGEEVPVDPGHNEAAWSKNRRVEIKYIGR
ncbi:MAG: peptidoglycan-associated lipoprotein Pal, partial [Leucothrix sp.]